MRRQATEQLKLHPLRSLRTAHNLTHHVRTRRKIKLENRLSGSPHIRKYCLPEMPMQKLIDWSMRILKELLIEMFAGDALAIRSETHDLVIILNNYYLLKPHYNLVIRTSGLIDIS